MKIKKKIASIFAVGLLSSVGFLGFPEAKAIEIRAEDKINGIVTSVDEEEISIKKKVCSMGSNEHSTLYFELLRLKDMGYENRKGQKEERILKILVMPGDFKVGDKYIISVKYPYYSGISFKDLTEIFAPGYEPIQKGFIFLDAITEW